MLHIIEQTQEEKLKMYMKYTKKELAKMLLECNKFLDYKKPKFTIVNSDKDK